MKFHLFLVLLFVSSFAFSQKGKMRLSVTSTDSAVSGDLPYVNIYQGGKTINQGYRQWNKSFLVDLLDTGYYKVEVKVIGQRSKAFDSIYITTATVVEKDLLYPGPCIFNYNKGFHPTCLKGHKDKIIPIFYGYPSKHSMKLAKKGKIHLGGCIVSNCDPQYYCTIHELEL